MVFHIYELYGNFRVFYLKQCLIVEKKKKSTRNVVKSGLLKILYGFLRDIRRCIKKKQKQYDYTKVKMKCLNN